MYMVSVGANFEGATCFLEAEEELTKFDEILIMVIDQKNYVFVKCLP